MDDQPNDDEVMEDEFDLQAEITNDSGHDDGSRERDMEDSDTWSQSVPIEYNRELPAEHSYFGELNSVRGHRYLEEGKLHRIRVKMHHATIFPGETFPLITSNSAYFNDDSSPGDGILIAVAFEEFGRAIETIGALYGVTCQVFEMGAIGFNVSFKSRAAQRFILRRSDNPDFESIINGGAHGMKGNIQVLPNILLPSSLLPTGSAKKFKMNDSMKSRLKLQAAVCTPWPTFVHNIFDVERLSKKYETHFPDVKPDEETALSFRLLRNFAFDRPVYKDVFVTDSELQRMLIIERALDKLVGPNESYFFCITCHGKIADRNDIIAMSADGIQSNYCNPGGYVHEINTVKSILPLSIRLVGRSTSDFSWFPGYYWQIANCSTCRNHLGWKFTAAVNHLVPSSFYGLARSSITMMDRSGRMVSQDENETEDEDSIDIPNSLESLNSPGTQEPPN